MQTLVLIDDDELIQATWKMCARTKGHKLTCFSTEEEFLKASISQDVPIYIDLHFRNGKDGISIAKNLFVSGYKNLYIATGTAPSTFKKPTEIIEILGKEYPY